MSKKLTDKELKKLDKYLKHTIAVASTAVFKALMLMASDGKIKSSALVFTREGDQINMELRIGAIQLMDGNGKIITLNDSVIKSIEHVGEGDGA